MPMPFMMLLLFATVAQAAATAECSAGAAGGACAAADLEAREVEEAEFASAELLQTKAGAPCPAASKQYYAMTNVCSTGFEDLKSKCPKKYDHRCETARYDFRNNCKSAAYNCYRAIKRVCGSGTPSQEVSSITKCAEIPVAFSCRYYGRSALLSRTDKCDLLKEQRKAECPQTKLMKRCWGAAYQWRYTCVKAAEECEEAIKSLGDCSNETALGELAKCKGDFPLPPVVPLVPGKKLTLVDNAQYTISSIIGCNWAGYLCNKPIGFHWSIKNSLRIHPNERYAAKFRLVSTGKPDEFYIYPQLGSCINKTEADDYQCGAVSYSPKSKCPEAAWNKAFKDCVEARRGYPYEKTPFVFTNVNGTDQFIIRTSSTCPSGAFCNWQLASNEESCGKQLPRLTLEKLSFENPWRLAPVS